jgi:cytochrome c
MLISFLALRGIGTAQNGEHRQRAFENRCSACHSLDDDKGGLRLRGVSGRMSGSVASFQYSDALQAARIARHAPLDKWLVLLRNSLAITIWRPNW